MKLVRLKMKTKCLEDFQKMKGIYEDYAHEGSEAGTWRRDLLQRQNHVLFTVSEVLQGHIPRVN